MKKVVLLALLSGLAYSAPVITELDPPSMDTQGGHLTIRGTGLDDSDPSIFNQEPTVTLNGQVLSRSTTTPTQIRVFIPPGQGANLELRVTFQSASSTRSFSYNPPVIGNTSGTFGTAGGTSFFLPGQNFGPSPGGEVRVNGQSVPVTSWNHSAIYFESPPGMDSASVQVVAGNQSSNTVEIAYQPPTLAVIPAANFPTQGAIPVTLTGNNFGTNPRIELSYLTSTQVVFAQSVNAAHTQAVFALPPGEGSKLVRVLAGTKASNGRVLTYNPPDISSVSPDTGPATAENTVELTGSNFGASPEVFFNGLSATIVSATDSSIIFRTPITNAGTSHILVKQGDQLSAPLAYTSTGVTSPPGFYIDAGSGEVLPAPAGTYTPEWNMTTPIPTPPGFYAPIAGLSGPIPAPAGTWTPIEGSTSVNPVPAGFVVDPNDPRFLVALPPAVIEGYEIATGGQQTLTFSTAVGQTYGIFFSQDLSQYTLVTSVQGLGASVTRSVFPPVSSTGRGFWVVAPMLAP